jgi:hypothetical protein
VILAVVRACVFWTVMHAQAPEPEDPVAPRIVGPPPSLVRSDAVHLGARPSSDVAAWLTGDVEVALTLQLTVRTPW